MCIRDSLGTGTNTTVITGDSITQTAGTQTNTSTAGGNTVADGTKSTGTTAAGQVIKDGAKSVSYTHLMQQKQVQLGILQLIPAQPIKRLLKAAIQ